MKITLIKNENHMTYLTVKAEEADMETYMEKIYQRLLKRIEVPGFNRGTAPRDVLERNVGRDRMVEEAIKEMVPAAHSQAIKEYSFQTEMQPIVKILQKEPAVFEMVVPLKPIVELGDYHSIKVEPDSLEIKEEEVDEVLEGLRVQFAKHDMVDRPVQEGDLITIDIEGIVLESPILSKKGVKFQVSPEFANDIPGLYKKMIGIKKGEEKEFKLKLPEDYTGKLVAGKEVLFKVKVYDIQAIVLPELNDEFANKVAPDLKTLDLLKERIEKNMRIEREQNADARFEEKVVESLIDISKLEYPPIMIDMESQGLINEYKEQLQTSCKDNREYEEKLKQLPEAVLKERALPLAKKRILWSLVVNEAAKAENIEVDDEEVDEEIERMISGSNEEKREQREYLNDDQNRQNVYNLLKARKTIKKLVEIVKASKNN